MRLRDRLRPTAAPGDPASVGTASPLAGLDLLERRITPPNAIGRGPLVDEPGFGVAIVAIVRNEGRYLEEWLSYHAALGVDHVFLYDNRSTDDSADLLEPWIDHGLVTRLDWPQLAGQVAAYNHALRMFGRVATWLLFVDPDEYLVPLVDDDIPTLLARFPRASDVRLPRREFAFSGHREPPPGLTIASYTQVADVFGRGEDAAARVKTALRPTAVAAMTVHLAVLAAEERRPAGLSTVGPDELAGIAQVNHYYTRSFAEYERKRAGTSASGRHERPALPLDLPTLETDEAAMRFVERTIAFRDSMRSLDPQPQRYGSRLRLDQFPRANDVGRYGERFVTDVAGGLDDLTGEGRVRIRNVHPGIGFVGDLGKAGRRPVPAALSGSPHLEALLITLRARLDGAAIPPDGSPVALGPDATRDAVTIDLAVPERRRVYLVGFIVEVDAPATLELRLEADGEPAGAPAVIPLKRATTWVGIVEVDAEPRHGRGIQARLSSDAPARLHDLFVLSHG